MLLAATDYPLLDIFWTMLFFFVWVTLFMLVFRIIVDLFRRDDMGGFPKALWILFVIVTPFLGVLIYVISQGGSMARRNPRKCRGAGAVRRPRPERGRERRRGRRDREGQEPARQRRHHAGGVREAQGRGARVAPQREAVWRSNGWRTCPITDPERSQPPGDRAAWWIAVLFAAGSLLFFIAPFPGFVQVFGSAAAGTAFFAGSVLFTVAAVIQCAVTYRAKASRPIDWCSSILLLAGTVLFNVNTFRATRTRVRSPGVQPARLGAEHPRLALLRRLGLPRLRAGLRRLQPVAAAPDAGVDDRRHLLRRVHRIRRLRGRLALRAVDRWRRRPRRRQHLDRVRRPVLRGRSTDGARRIPADRPCGPVR